MLNTIYGAYWRRFWNWTASLSKVWASTQNVYHRHIHASTFKTVQ